MSTNFPVHNSLAWAVWHPQAKFFCGRYCWPDTAQFGPVIPTFPTRSACKDAISRMRSYRSEAVPMRVSVTLMQLEKYK